MANHLIVIWKRVRSRLKSGKRQDCLLEYFKRHNEEYLKRIGHGRSRKSYQRYVVVYKHLQAFLQKRQLEDLSVRAVTGSLIRDFEQYLRVDEALRNNTVWVYMIALKHVLSLSLAAEGVTADPFAGFRNRFEQVDRGYLTEEELQALMQLPLPPGTRRLVRDLFVFAAFTGLSYADVKALRWDNVRKLFDGNTWIVTRRAKTHTPSSVLLLDIPLQILERHGDRNAGQVFRVPSNNCCNGHLARLGKACGTATHLTFHIARHTFATLSLSKGVPIETISSVLGHTSIRTTQIYAKITNQKISEDMSRLSARLQHLLFSV